MDATEVKVWRRQERARLIALRMENGLRPGANGIAPWPPFCIRPMSDRDHGERYALMQNGGDAICRHHAKIHTGRHGGQTECHEADLRHGLPYSERPRGWSPVYAALTSNQV